MIVIKVAHISDAVLIADMSRKAFYDTFAEHNTKEDMDKFLSTQFTKRQLMAELGVEGNSFFIAYNDDLPAGYLFLKIETHPALGTDQAIAISRLYANKLSIGKGIGKALMTTAIGFAQTAYKDTIWLGVWEHNLRAINFYTSFGFEKFGEHDFILGDDVQRDWLMKLSL